MHSKLKRHDLKREKIFKKAANDVKKLVRTYLFYTKCICVYMCAYVGVPIGNVIHMHALPLYHYMCVHIDIIYIYLY